MCYSPVCDNGVLASSSWSSRLFQESRIIHAFPGKAPEQSWPQMKGGGFIRGMLPFPKLLYVHIPCWEKKSILSWQRALFSLPCNKMGRRTTKQFHVECVNPYIEAGVLMDATWPRKDSLVDRIKLLKCSKTFHQKEKRAALPTLTSRAEQHHFWTRDEEA